MDVQAITSSTNNKIPYRDDGCNFYIVEYQTNLLLNSGQQIPIQNFSYREDYWEPASGKPATAEIWAEETAEFIRDFIIPTLRQNQEQTEVVR